MAIDWASINGVATIATAVIATLVYLEARRIRHTEWLTRSVQLWQGFNAMLLDRNRAERWRSFLRGEVPEAEFRPDDHYVLYSYLNIIYSEYRYLRHGLLDRRYAVESLRDNLNQVAAAGPYVIRFLRDTGYDNDLVDMLQAVVDGKPVSVPGRTESIRAMLRLVRRRRVDGHTGSRPQDGT
jgi:hypothetical protein